METWFFAQWNLVEDVEILLPVKFRWIPFSGFRGEVENVSTNQRPGRPSCFSDRPEKHKLGRGRCDLASYQVTLNSVRQFQRRSRKCEKLTTDGRRTDDGRTDDGQSVITIVHLSLRLRCTKQEAHVGHCRSPEYNERVKNLTSKWNQKQQSFIPHASRSLLCIRFVAVAFWAKKKNNFFKMGTPVTYFCPALDLPLGRYGRNILMHIRGHKHFILTKFHKHPSCGSN